MSRENVDALKRALSAPVDEPEDFFAILDEDIVWDGGDVPGGKAYGRDGVREFFRQWIGAFDDFRYEAKEFIDAGSSVFVRMRQWGRGKGSGVTTQIDLWQVYLFFEGKVVRFVQKRDRREALAAAGLPEEAMSHENVEIVRQVYAEWELGNLGAAAELFDPEIVFESFMPDSNERVVACGVEEIEAFTREFLTTSRDYRMIGEEFRAVGDDKVFVAGRQAVTGRQSGVPIDGPAFWVWTLRGGRVVRLLFETRKREALEAAGLQ